MASTKVPLTISSLYKTTKHRAISLGASAPSLLLSKDIERKCNEWLGKRKLDRDAINVIKKYVNGLIEYSILQSVIDNYNPYDGTVYINGVDIDRNGDHILDKMKEESLSNAIVVNNDINPFLLKEDSCQLSPYLHL